MSVVVAQLGARMHYAVPRIFSRVNALERLYTDLYALKGLPRLLRTLPHGLRPLGLRRLSSRFSPEIPAKRVTAFSTLGLEYIRRLARAKDADERNAAFLWSGNEFCRRTISAGFGKASLVYTFNSAGLEILQTAQERGLKGVVEQTITPRQIERKILENEQRHYPDWEMPMAPEKLDQYCARERAEWAVADLVVCGSEYVRKGIIEAGGMPEKIAVVPYGLEFGVRSPPKKLERQRGPLRVLTVGSVCLRKGSPYVLAAAKLAGADAEFRMVGPIQVGPIAELALRQHITMVGVIPRSEVIDHYDWADVFLLPSLCEGSATVSYEALYNGLPVICTPETGSVVRDDIDGFIVPSRNAAAIVEKLIPLGHDPRRLKMMSESARERSREYTLAKYGGRLISMLCNQVSPKVTDPASG
ncbi:MAG: hypothetical protein QOD64_1226 [Verrucomicrobiota bacterium]